MVNKEDIAMKENCRKSKERIALCTNPHFESMTGGYLELYVLCMERMRLHERENVTCTHTINVSDKNFVRITLCLVALTKTIYDYLVPSDEIARFKSAVTLE